MVAARVRDLGAVAARRARAGIESAAENRRSALSADVFKPGAVRHRVGSRRCGDGVLRLRTAIRALTQAMARSADRLASACTRQADVDDQRDHQGATAGPAGRAIKRCRQSRAATYLDGQAE